MMVQAQKAQENTRVEALKSYQTLFINASSVVSKLKVKSPYTEHRHLSLMPEFVTALYSYRTNLY